MKRSACVLSVWRRSFTVNLHWPHRCSSTCCMLSPGIDILLTDDMLLDMPVHLLGMLFRRHFISNFISFHFEDISIVHDISLMEDVLLDMPVHLLTWNALSNSLKCKHPLLVYLYMSSQTLLFLVLLAYRARSRLFAVNALYKLLTYSLTHLLTYCNIHLLCGRPNRLHYCFPVSPRAPNLTTTRRKTKISVNVLQCASSRFKRSKGQDCSRRTPYIMSALS